LNDNFTYSGAFGGVGGSWVGQRGGRGVAHVAAGASTPNRALEKELGAPVSERLWRGVRITAAGRATAEEARVALRAAEQAVQIGQRVARAGAGRIRISCVETMTAWLLLPVLRQWRSRRPDVHLDLSEFTSADAIGLPALPH
jgi:DNA-binding transcriptional LysR family regulator